MNRHKVIQEQWREGYLPGYDCITYGDGKVTMGNTYKVFDDEKKEEKRFWFPLCDTTLEGILKYDEDVWTKVDISHGAFEYQNQRFVFGEGAMGNEGFIASTATTGELNWANFFTFSNPIHKAEVIDEHLICYGDSGDTRISINLIEITQVEVTRLPFV